MHILNVKGFTLLELLLVLTLLGLLLGIGVPAMSRQLEQVRLSRAAETLASDLRLARQLAIERQQAVYVNFSGQTPACYTISDRVGCPCTDSANACIIRSALGRYARIADRSHFNGIALDEVRFGINGYTRFDPRRGTARSGHIDLRGTDNRRLRVTISLLGRVRICRPDVNQTVTGYPLC